MSTESEDLITVMHHLKTLVSQIRPQGNMTFGEFCVMSMIESKEKEECTLLTPTSLNDLLGTKKPATSRTLAVLEKKGYLAKKSDEKDHRICYLELTNQGKVALEQEREFYQDIMQRIVKRIGTDEIQSITKALNHLSNILEEMDELVSDTAL